MRKLKFINLFAGLGGFHPAFQSLGHIFLENAANLHGHNEGNTWQVIHTELSKLYDAKEDILDVPLPGRALRCNLFVHSSQKGFPLQPPTQKTTSTF